MSSKLNESSTINVPTPLKSKQIQNLHNRTSISQVNEKSFDLNLDKSGVELNPDSKRALRQNEVDNLNRKSIKDMDDLLGITHLEKEASKS